MKFEQAYKELLAYAKEATELELPDLQRRTPSLRVSGFPFCGLQTLINRQDTEQHTHDMGMPYYTSVGTAAHLVFQRYFGNKGSIFGNWKCYSCKNVLRLSTIKLCPICGNEMEYEELEVAYGKHLTGHVDGIFQASDGSYWILDYKTTSSKALRTHKKEGDLLPYGKNVHQIMAYCALIEHQYGMKISGWFLLYIVRDDPKQSACFGDSISRDVKENILDICDLYNRQMTAIQKFEATQSKKAVTFLIETKPCPDREYYLEHMKGMKDCPLLSVCFTDRLQEAVEDVLHPPEVDG